MENGAAKALAEWNKALALCKVEGGKKLKMPKQKEDIGAALTKSAALAKKVDEQATQLLASIKAYQTALSDVEGACDGYSGVVDKDEFGLSKKDPDEEKSMNKIRYILSKKLTDISLGSKSPRKEAAKVRSDLEAVDFGSF